MAVNVDTVYQKVLALSSKEQRGYVTPQEFNLLADKAQLEIFDSYFHDIKTAYHKPKNQMGVAFDEIEILQEKLHPFKAVTTSTIDQALMAGPAALYKINTISTDDQEITELTQKEILYTENNPLTQATTNRMVYVREQNAFRLYPTPTEAISVIFDYWRTPTTPRWGYVVVNKRALYNNSTTYSTNFELHASEEEVLVSRILQLAGVVMMKPGIVEVGAAEKAGIKAEQNN